MGATGEPDEAFFAGFSRFFSGLSRAWADIVDAAGPTRRCLMTLVGDTCPWRRGFAENPVPARPLNLLEALVSGQGRPPPVRKKPGRRFQELTQSFDAALGTNGARLHHREQSFPEFFCFFGHNLLSPD